MDHARGLIEPAEPATHAADCPDCGAPSPDLPTPRTTLLEAVPLRRCFRCGRRSTAEPAPRRVLECSTCSLPFLERAGGGDRCAQCGDEGAPAPEPPDEPLIAATEAEVRVALAEAWEFAASASASRYLRRVRCEVARHIGGAPEGARVLLVRHCGLRALALPSGTVILSTGMLEALEDEAELAFVLGHELAHVAAGDAAVTLVRAGLRDLAAPRCEPGRSSWVDVALDLIRLGHGDRREHAADARALEAMAAAGYDPDCAARYLDRLRDRSDHADPSVAELALAHPPATDRMRAVDTVRSLRLTATAASRVDREVFRRTVGHSALSSELERVQPFDDPPGGSGLAALVRSPLVWTVAIAILVLGLLVFWGLAWL